MFSTLIKVLVPLALLLGIYAAPTVGYPSYNGNVPNGNQVPPSAIELGHPGGATKRYTSFANAYVSSGRKWSLALCKGDADGDGQSNGLEMGDPCCTWTVGAQPLFLTGLSDPNHAESTTTNTNQSCV